MIEIKPTKIETTYRHKETGELFKERKDWETKGYKAKIVQVLTRPSEEYDLPTAEAQVRDLDAVVEKLNTTFQEELKQEVEAVNFFLS